MLTLQETRVQLWRSSTIREVDDVRFYLQKHYNVPFPPFHTSCSLFKHRQRQMTQVSVCTIHHWRKKTRVWRERTQSEKQREQLTRPLVPGAQQNSWTRGFRKKTPLREKKIVKATHFPKEIPFKMCIHFRNPIQKIYIS